MAVGLEQFVKQLSDSGVIAPGKLENFVPPKAQPKDAQELARQLVQSKQLTKFQAQEIYAGRAKSLTLGNYTILDKIGAGGMGQVFKAEHRRMKRVVAIKTLPKAFLKDAAAVARFQREVEAAAKLSHPNIVAAFDADEAGGVNFLVMEYVEGSDLSALVKKCGSALRRQSRELHPAGGEGTGLRPQTWRDPPRHQARQSAARQRRHDQDSRHGLGPLRLSQQCRHAG